LEQVRNLKSFNLSLRGFDKVKGNSQVQEEQMKIKILATIGLGAFMLLSGCRGDSNANVAGNNSITNMTANNTGVVTSTPMMADTATKTVVEEALKKKGFTDVTVDATSEAVTLRGSVAKGKLGEAVQTATEAGKRRVINQMTEK